MAASYTCRWCRHESDGSGTTCPYCGAPVDIRLRTSDSGWTELPAIPDMARIQFGQSSCQVEGTFVPAVDMKLAAGDTVYFSHHVLLWQDPGVELAQMSLKGAWNRMLAGMPLVMLQASGPGHIAFSHDKPGELVALPLQPGMSVDVRENHFLVATSAVGYDWHDSGIWFTTTGGDRKHPGVRAGMALLKVGLEMASDALSDGGGDGGGGGDDGEGGNEVEWHYPLGQYLDRFTTGTTPGLLLLHAGGNSFVRDLAEGETILIKPPSLLFKDPTIAMQLHVEYPESGLQFWRHWSNRHLWLRLWGPGRVAVQSSYDRFEDPGSSFQDTCGHTEQHW